MSGHGVIIAKRQTVAGVAKWLRQWFVVPPFVGSSPIVRPQFLFIRIQIVVVNTLLCEHLSCIR